jgi:hypothetical protein
MLNACHFTARFDSCAPLLGLLKQHFDGMNGIKVPFHLAVGGGGDFTKGDMRF